MPPVLHASKAGPLRGTLNNSLPTTDLFIFFTFIQSVYIYYVRFAAHENVYLRV